MFTIQVKILPNQWCSKTEDKLLLYLVTVILALFQVSFSSGLIDAAFTNFKIDSDVPHKLDFWKNTMNTKNLETDLNFR